MVQLGRAQSNKDKLKFLFMKETKKNFNKDLVKLRKKLRLVPYN